MAELVAEVWKPADWITLVGAIAGVLGVLAALVGVVLGARLSRAASETSHIRSTTELALAKAYVAIDSMNGERLSTEELHDRSLGLDRSNERLGDLESGELVWPARDALAVLRVCHPSKKVQDMAGLLGSDLLWLHSSIAGWYRLIVAIRNGDRASDDGAGEALASALKAHESAQSHWQELQALAGLKSSR